MMPGTPRFGPTCRGIAAAIPQPAPRTVAATDATAALGFDAFEPRLGDALAWGRVRAAAYARAAAVAWTAGGRAPGHDLLDRLWR